MAWQRRNLRADKRALPPSSFLVHCLRKSFLGALLLQSVVHLLRVSALSAALEARSLLVHLLDAVVVMETVVASLSSQR